MLKILPTRDEEVTRLSRNGVTIARQADILNVHPETIKSIRSRLGLVKNRQDPLRSEEKEFILKCIRDGITYSDTADLCSKTFGTPRTRGTVAGIVNRAGAKGAKSQEIIVRQMLETKRKRGSLQPPILKKLAVKKRKNHITLTDPALYPKPERIDLSEIFIGSGVKFSDIEPDGCRWPLDLVDGEHSFCGCKTEHRPYCDKHRAIACR
jgi:hypothetical protein